MAVGAYHIVGARNDLLAYIRASVWGRIGFAVLLSVLVATSVTPRSLLLFAAIDLAAAAWTAIALRQASLARSLCTILGVTCALPAASRAQTRVDLEPYAGLYGATTSLTTSGVLKQATSASVGTRLVILMPGRVGLEWTVNYAPSNVATTGVNVPCPCGTFPFPGPNSAHVASVGAKVLVRLSPADAITTFHLGGGLGIVSHGGPAYTVDTYEGDHSTSLGGLLDAGLAFKLARSLALLSLGLAFRVGWSLQQ